MLRHEEFEALLKCGQSTAFYIKSGQGIDEASFFARLQPAKRVIRRNGYA
jgi:hypothetical protein